MAKKAGIALGFALLVLLSVLAVPTILDSRDDTEIQSKQIEQGDTAFYNHQLELTVVDAGQTNTDVILYDTETGERANRTIATDTTETFDFNRGTINVTSTVSTSTSATMAVEYGSTYGYSDSSLVIVDNLPLILLAMVFIGIMAFVGIRP